MVVVRVSVLVEPDGTAGAPAIVQGRSERIAQQGGNHREVDRARMAIEHIEQREQASISPPGVIVAEEDVNVALQRIERARQRREPPAHAVHLIDRSATVPCRINVSRISVVRSAPCRSSADAAGVNEESAVISETSRAGVSSDGSTIRSTPSASRRRARLSCSSSPASPKGTTRAATRLSITSSAVL